MPPIVSTVGPINRSGGLRYQPYARTRGLCTTATGLQDVSDPSGGDPWDQSSYMQRHASSSSKPPTSHSPPSDPSRRRSATNRSTARDRKTTTDRSQGRRRRTTNDSRAGTSDHLVDTTIETACEPCPEEVDQQESPTPIYRGPPIPREKATMAYANEPHARELVDQAIQLLRELWHLAPEPAFPPGYTLPGHERPSIPFASTRTTAQLDATLIMVDPAALAERAALDAQRMLTPPDLGLSTATAGHTLGAIPPQAVSVPSEADTSSPLHDNQVDEASVHLPGPAADHSMPVLTAGQGSTLAGANPHSSYATASLSLHFFVHEILRRSFTSCRILEIAMCYLGALGPSVAFLLRECQRVVNIARLRNISIKDADERGVFETPVNDARKMFLTSIVVATKFHQDRSYSNRAWSKLSGLKAEEITKCEKALGQALDWRLWVGRITPVTESTDPSLVAVPGAIDSRDGRHVAASGRNPHGLQGCANCIDRGGPLDTTPGIVSSGRCLSPPPSHISADVLEWEGYQEDIQVLQTACPSCVDAVLEGRDSKTLSFIDNSNAAEARRDAQRAQAKQTRRQSRKDSTLRRSSSIATAESSKMSTLSRTRSLPIESFFVYDDDETSAQTATNDFMPRTARVGDSNPATPYRFTQPAAPCMIDGSSFRVESPASFSLEQDPSLHCLDLNVGGFVPNNATGFSGGCTSPSASDVSRTCASEGSSPETAVESIAFQMTAISRAPFVTSMALPVGSTVGAYRPTATPPPQAVIEENGDYPGWQPPNHRVGLIAMTPPKDYRMLFDHTILNANGPHHQPLSSSTLIESF